MICNKCGEETQITVIGILCYNCGQIAPLNLRSMNIEYDKGLNQLVKTMEGRQ